MSPLNILDAGADIVTVGRILPSAYDKLRNKLPHERLMKGEIYQDGTLDYLEASQDKILPTEYATLHDRYITAEKARETLGAPMFLGSFQHRKEIAQWKSDVRT
ncbi:hypothetical protein SCP_0302850 [Sparassis crispa]|uniref:Uncharacterized protein n=1 Tax=Sparassis crispa TaxID=139825 RepID=A0A401GEH2_9APHY|nr:hypothetical protein SCP_0302850 [Sparassis crispa]GBE80570.1 hypothetical protein SCP_0302850 [Sparassis crispa]